MTNCKKCDDRAKYYGPHWSHNNELVTGLLKKISFWQIRHGLTPDGLIGPNTWRKKDAELEQLARSLFDAMIADTDTHVSQVYHFLRRNLFPNTGINIEGLEGIHVVSNGKLLCVSYRGDPAWDTREKRKELYDWITKTDKTLTIHDTLINSIAKEINEWVGEPYPRGFQPEIYLKRIEILLLEYDKKINKV